jgi:hypothetical protein
LKTTPPQGAPRATQALSGPIREEMWEIRSRAAARCQVCRVRYDSQFDPLPMTTDSDTRNPAPRDFTEPPSLASTHSVRQKIPRGKTMSNQILPRSPTPRPSVGNPPHFFIKTDSVFLVAIAGKRPRNWGYPVGWPDGKIVIAPTNRPHFPSPLTNQPSLQSHFASASHSRRSFDGRGFTLCPCRSGTMALGPHGGRQERWPDESKRVRPPSEIGAARAITRWADAPSRTIRSPWAELSSGRGPDHCVTFGSTTHPRLPTLGGDHFVNCCDDGRIVARDQASRPP